MVSAMVAASASAAGVTRIQDDTIATIVKHCCERKDCPCGMKSGSCPAVLKNNSLKSLVRRGIAPEHRPTAWYLLSGGQARAQAAAPGTYQALIDRATAQPTFLDMYSTIRRDCDSVLYMPRSRSSAPMLQRSSDVKKPSSMFPRSSLRQPSPPDRQIRRGNSLGGAALPTSVKIAAPTSVKPAVAIAGVVSLVEPRTHSGNSLLSSNSNSSTEASADALANIMLAFTQMDPTRVYNSAYTRVAATLLGVFGAADEERAFWTLAAMLENRLFPHTKGELLAGAKVEVKVLQQLLPSKAPRVAAYLAGMRVDVGALVGSWFSGLFTTLLSTEVSLRVWDCMMCDGPKALIRVALALLKKYESAIVSCTEVDLLRRLMPVRVKHGSADADELIKSAFLVGTLRGSVLCNMRSAVLPALA